jgi:hypothetical protein
VRVAGPKDSWIRFAVLEIPFDQIPRGLFEAFWAWEEQQRMETLEDLDEPLPFE